MLIFRNVERSSLVGKLDAVQRLAIYFLGMVLQRRVVSITTEISLAVDMDFLPCSFMTWTPKSRSKLKSDLIAWSNCHRRRITHERLCSPRLFPPPCTLFLPDPLLLSPLLLHLSLPILGLLYFTLH